MRPSVVIIPARFSSVRFPGKPLAKLHGKPLIRHVYEQAARAKKIESVMVATDDTRVRDVVVGFGGRAVMTSPKHESGTDRIAEAVRAIQCEIVVNVQGDEPFVRPEMIDAVVTMLSEDGRAELATLAKKTSDLREILSPNTVKVVTDKEGFALYFSRSPIPYHRDNWNSLREIEYSTGGTEVFKHIGIYGFTRDSLLKFAQLPPSRPEKTERLEQLRALDAGMKIKVGETVHDTLGIDTAEDLRKAEEWLSLSL